MNITPLKKLFISSVSGTCLSVLTACANTAVSEKTVASKTTEKTQTNNVSTAPKKMKAKRKTEKTAMTPAQEKLRERRRQMIEKLPQRQIMVRPGGPVNKPVPGLGPVWPALGSDNMAGQWRMASSQSPENYELILSPKGVNVVGEVRFSGSSPFSNQPNIYWRVDRNGNFYLLDGNYQTIWRAGRVGQKQFKGVLGGPDIYSLSPINP